MNILSWTVLGSMAGAIAKFVAPGTGGGGILVIVLTSYKDLLKVHPHC